MFKGQSLVEDQVRRQLFNRRLGTNISVESQPFRMRLKIFSDESLQIISQFISRILVPSFRLRLSATLHPQGLQSRVQTVQQKLLD